MCLQLADHIAENAAFSSVATRPAATFSCADVVVPTLASSAPRTCCTARRPAVVPRHSVSYVAGGAILRAAPARSEASHQRLIRHRGEERARSWEYVVDIGVAAAQRCRDCDRVSGWSPSLKECCPECGGGLRETEERRRAIRVALRPRRSCKSRLDKVLTTIVLAATCRPPGSDGEGLSCARSEPPAVEGAFARPPTPATPCSPRNTSSRAWAACNYRGSRLPRSTRSRSPWRTWPRSWRRPALGLFGAPRARRSAQGLSRRRALGQAHSQPSGRRRPA